MTRVPLRARDGRVRAWALIDDADAPLVLARSWHLSKHGYVVHATSRAGRPVTFLLHRVVMALGHGDPREVDHQNGDKCDCRRSNLRVVTHAQNAQNILRTRGRSRFRGVSFHRRKRRWQAKVTLATRQQHLGYFDSELDAAAAVQQARGELMPFAEPDPEFVRLAA